MTIIRKRVYRNGYSWCYKIWHSEGGTFQADCFTSKEEATEAMNERWAYETWEPE